MAGWIGISSSHYDSSCGDSFGLTLENALGGTTDWEHFTTETHWFIVDLLQTYNVTKVRARSDVAGYDPVDVNIFVSNDKGNWGGAVATGISTWKNTVSWVEIDTTDKEGRYVKVEILSTEHAADYLGFGEPVSPFTIFDVYSPDYISAGAISPLINSGIMNSLLLNGGLIG